MISKMKSAIVLGAVAILLIAGVSSVLVVNTNNSTNFNEIGLDVADTEVSTIVNPFCGVEVDSDLTASLGAYQLDPTNAENEAQALSQLKDYVYEQSKRVKELKNNAEAKTHELTELIMKNQPNSSNTDDVYWGVYDIRNMAYEAHSILFAVADVIDTPLVDKNTYISSKANDIRNEVTDIQDLLEDVIYLADDSWNKNYSKQTDRYLDINPPIRGCDRNIDPDWRFNLTCKALDEMDCDIGYDDALMHAYVKDNRYIVDDALKCGDGEKMIDAYCAYGEKVTTPCKNLLEEARSIKTMATKLAEEFKDNKTVAEKYDSICLGWDFCVGDSSAAHGDESQLFNAVCDHTKSLLEKYTSMVNNLTYQMKNIKNKVGAEMSQLDSESVVKYVNEANGLRSQLDPIKSKADVLFGCGFVYMVELNCEDIYYQYAEDGFFNAYNSFLGLVDMINEA